MLKFIIYNLYFSKKFYRFTIYFERFDYIDTSSCFLLFSTLHFFLFSTFIISLISILYFNSFIVNIVMNDTRDSDVNK